jgi:hypothetical protein
MSKYYVNDNAQPTGEHEVHTQNCMYLPENRTYIGEYSNCHDALNKARTIYTNVDGCSYCSPACHTK